MVNHWVSSRSVPFSIFRAPTSQVRVVERAQGLPSGLHGGPRAQVAVRGRARRRSQRCPEQQANTVRFNVCFFGTQMLDEIE